MNKKKIKKDKKPVKIPLSPVGILGPGGYYSGDPEEKRRIVLDRLMKKYEYKAIILRLNATAIRLKNTKPELTRNLRSDMAYLKQKYRSKPQRPTKKAKEPAKGN